MAAEPRHQTRESFTDASRIILLENDADRAERELVAFKVEMRAEIKQIKALAWGVMVSATTATIVGALNLLFGHVK